jgi:hypothetical protein
VACCDARIKLLEMSYSMCAIYISQCNMHLYCISWEWCNICQILDLYIYILAFDNKVPVFNMPVFTWTRRMLPQTVCLRFRKFFVLMSPARYVRRTLALRACGSCAAMFQLCTLSRSTFAPWSIYINGRTCTHVSTTRFETSDLLTSRHGESSISYEHHVQTRSLNSV